jgi:hypothetical protein
MGVTNTRMGHCVCADAAGIVCCGDFCFFGWFWPCNSSFFWRVGEKRRTNKNKTSPHTGTNRVDDVRKKPGDKRLSRCRARLCPSHAAPTGGWVTAFGLVTTVALVRKFRVTHQYSRACGIPSRTISFSVVQSNGPNERTIHWRSR